MGRGASVGCFGVGIEGGRGVYRFVRRGRRAWEWVVSRYCGGLEGSKYLNFFSGFEYPDCAIVADVVERLQQRRRCDW